MSDTTITTEDFESVIRNLARDLTTMLRTRRDHPTYGVTKRLLRDVYQRLAGAIGAYGILTRQIVSAETWALVTFTDPETTELVENARTDYAVEILP